MNTAEWAERYRVVTGYVGASMGPPREHGGMAERPRLLQRVAGASMGPPREHGGMLNTASLGYLLWVASMGPPREHGGMHIARPIMPTRKLSLQWGRRVNTAECHRWWEPRPSSAGFNGAAA